jgi:hypothetical protein
MGILKNRCGALLGIAIGNILLSSAFAFGPLSLPKVCISLKGASVGGCVCIWIASSQACLALVLWCAVIPWAHRRAFASILETKALAIFFPPVVREHAVHAQVLFKMAATGARHLHDGA